MFDISILEATAKAAIASYNFIGLGNEEKADQAAVDAMRTVLNQINFSAEIVIGEGERDQAPLLFMGEKLGIQKNIPSQFDIAVDPLEGTTICSHAKPGALSVLSIAPLNSLLKAPDVYMDKIATWITQPNIIDLDNSIEVNIKNIALYKQCSPSEVRVIILNRPRHKVIIDQIRAIGAKIELIDDGDIAAVIKVALKQADIYLGIGGAPEGVLAACALKTLGGQIFARLIFQNDNEKAKAKTVLKHDFDFKYSLNDLVKDDVLFCATGVTTGPILDGVIINGNAIETHSLILYSKNKQVLKIKQQYL